jgi:hypothetical protein
VNESWTDFEKYVFDKLEANHADHAKLHADIAVLKERTKPKAKPISITLKVSAILALIMGIIAAFRGVAK